METVIELQDAHRSQQGHTVQVAGGELICCNWWSSDTSASRYIGLVFAFFIYLYFKYISIKVNSDSVLKCHQSAVCPFSVSLPLKDCRALLLFTYLNVLHCLL